jgi:tetratricopeptide (TPR) repeat protein
MIRVSKFLLTTLIGTACLLLSQSCSAQAPGDLAGARSAGGASSGTLIPSHLEVYVQDAKGGPVSEMALVTVTRAPNQYWRQVTTQAGRATFDNVMTGRYTVQVVVPGYETAVEDVDVSGSGGSEPVYIVLKVESPRGVTTPTAQGPPLLSPKAQKELAKALEALRASKLPEARAHLEAAHHLAPSHPDVNYLFGVYSSLVNDWPQAKAYWEKAIAIYPQHLLAQISISEMLLRENKPADAIPHLKHALEVDPASWRAHAHLADADLRVGSSEDAVREAERAIELGRERAAGVQRILARALVAQGKTDRAVQVLESYLREHPADSATQKQLDSLRRRQALPSDPASAAETLAVPVLPSATSLSTLASLSQPSNWRPPDVDETVPPVESGVPCALEEVVQNAGKRLQEFIRDVDRFTATESLSHVSVNIWGSPAPPETRKFNYLVSIQEVRPGILNVDEYRDGGMPYEKFPGGTATLGLPSLVLIFHPYNAVNYDMTCEGLAHWNGGLAWQIHFRQRADKPSRDRRYRVGSGPSYDVGLKGRAWIAPDTFQIVRLETDLVAPVPEIRLLTDHTAIEYSAVHFRERRVDMWLPRSAEVFYDMKGRRFHRRHTFSNYLLFSVDDQQHITTPKAEQTPPRILPSNPQSQAPLNFSSSRPAAESSSPLALRQSAAKACAIESKKKCPKF